MTRPIRIAETTDRDRLEAFFRRDAAAHVYPLADLDDFFWPKTRWFVAVSGGEWRAAALLLESLAIPLVYAVCPAAHADTCALMVGIRDQLPDRFFANLGPGIEHALGEGVFHLEGEYQKMELAEFSAPLDSTPEMELLGRDKLQELRCFYESDAYLPEERTGRFFEPFMLDLAPHLGIREGGRLVATGGVHVLSERYGVAALGNFATRPDRRGRGLGRAIARALCARLRERVERIGLNVRSDNSAAIRCYEDVGFRAHCRYIEGVFERGDARPRRESR